MERHKMKKISRKKQQALMERMLWAIRWLNEDQLENFERNLKVTLNDLGYHVKKGE